MKIGIIGGNSQVASETALYLKQLGHDVIPIIRNKLGAAHLAQLGFSYRIHDASSNSCDEVFNDLDIIVIAAHAEPYYRGYTTTSEAHDTNVNIIKNSIKHSDNETTLVYFSSIAAYGNDYSPSYRYIKEKRKIENKIGDMVVTSDRDWYALRLGHVLGVNTNYYKDIKQYYNSDIIRVPTSDGKVSNTVHPKVISEVIISCSNKEISSGVYGVVNNPQWTWEDVFNFVIPDVDIEFANEKSDNVFDGLVSQLKRNVLAFGWDLIGNSRNSRFSHLYTTIPRQVELKIYAIRKQYDWKSQISSVSDENKPIQLHLNIMDQPELSDDLYPDIPKIRPHEVEKFNKLEQIPL